MASITLTSEAKGHDLKRKDLFVTYTIPMDPANLDGTKIKLNIPYFSHGSEEEWLMWKKQFLHVKKAAGWSAGPILFANARNLLRDTALQRFEDEKTAQGSSDSVATFDKVLNKVTEAYCPGKAAQELKAYIRETSKPLSMTMDQYYARIETLNSYLPLLTAPDNEKLTQIELKQAIEHNVPRPWKEKYEESGQDFESIGKLVHYYKKCEARENKNKKKPGNEKNQKNNKFQKKERNMHVKENSKEKKWCKFHKSKTHNTAECRAKDKSKEEANAIASSDEECNAMATSEEGEEKDQKISMEIPIAIRQGKRYKVGTALIDCGSSRTLISSSFVPWGTQVNKVQRRWKTEGGNFTTTGQAVIKVKLPSFTMHRQVEQLCQITPKKKDTRYDMILGRDFLGKTKLKLNFESKTISWDELEIPMQEESKEQFLESFAQSNVLKEAEERVERILDAKYEKGNIEDAIPSHLNDMEKEELRNLLYEFEDLFQGKLGNMPGKPYEIPVRKDAKPYHARAFSIPQVYLETVKKEVERLEEIGVLEKNSESEWAAPCFVIPKKNKQVRLVTDFRKLNQQLIRHPFPMPRISEILQGLSKFAYISNIDFNMGYHSTRLTKKSSEVLTVIFPWGKYRYLRLPFGVNTAPDEFQKRMTNLIGDLPCARVYLDDVLVISQHSFQEHLRDLRAVLTRIREYGMQINLNKSKIAAKEAEYLGFKLTQHGIQPLPDKVKALCNMAVPTNRKELRRFIGMVNYYRDMWPQRAHNLAPLTAMTSAKTKFQWTEAHTKAFQAVKQTMITEVTLAYPDFTQPFVIYTDASTFQLGGVIMQDEKPLAFFSRKLNSAQRRYTVMEQELLSIVEILREFRNILLGHEIIVYTDHKNLSFSNFQSARVTRWRLLVEEFGPEIRYIKGTNNVVADTLSRHPMRQQSPMEEEELYELTTNPAILYPLSKDVIEQAQCEDEELSKGSELRQLLELKDRGEFKLYCKEDRIFVPRRLREEIMEYYHEILMHPGQNRTYASMKSHFWWPKMKKEVEDKVAKCATCSSWKRGGKEYGKLPTKTPDAKPWETVCVDLIGPYPIKGDNYDNGKFWALTIIDPVLGWFEMVPTTEKSSKTIGELFDVTWLCRYPRPEFCIHDQGTEFTGPEFQLILRENGITPKPTTVKNPQANAILERVHQVIGNHFRTSVRNDEDRRESIPAICFAIRATFKTTVQASPAQLVFGRDMMMDTIFTANWKNIAERKLKQVQIDNAKENDKRVEYKYSVGEMVYLLKDHKNLAKMKRPTLGPFKIVHIRNNGTVILDRGSYCETVNIRRLRPVNPRYNWEADAVSGNQ